MTTPLYISFGYRCTSAGLLKRMGLKTESHPFDWMVSRLSVIKDCIATDFAHFLNTEYVCRPTITASYEPHEGEMDVHVCDESVWLNSHYSMLAPSPEHTSKYWKIFGRDTYSYPMAFNHHNMILPETHEYYRRCIERLQRALSPEFAIRYLYIHPIQDMSEHDANKDTLINNFTQFHHFLTSRSGEKNQTSNPKTNTGGKREVPSRQASGSPSSRTAYALVGECPLRLNRRFLTGLFIMPIRTQHPYPITDYYCSPIRVLFKTEQITILSIFCNRDIVDAGEIWYRNGYIEEELAVQCINNYLVSGT